MTIKRKVIQIANSTQLVSLPRKWCLRNNIKKGDDVDLSDLGTRLLIETGKTGSALLKKRMHLDGKEKYLKYILHALYQKGYTEVVFIYETGHMADAIQRMLHEEMVGFEVVEQTPTTSVVRSVAGALPSEFDTILKRAFSLTVSMFEGLLDNVKQRKTHSLGSLAYMEANINKYVSFCKRMLNAGLIQQDQQVLIYAVLQRIEQISRETKFMCNRLEKEKQLDKKTQERFQDVYALLKSSFTLYYSYNFEKTLDLLEQRLSLIRKMQADLGNAFSHHLCNITQYLFELNKAKMQMEI
ncbi:MAG: hypothetical protein ACQESG_06415 [Nanobdellota archaeon]